MKRFFLFIICVGFFQLKTFADDCSTINPVKVPGSSDIQNQGGSGICYAFVCANLLEAKLRRPVSPLDVAYNSKTFGGKRVRNTEDLRQEKIMTCLQAAASQGLCCDEKFAQEPHWERMRAALENYERGRRPQACVSRKVSLKASTEKNKRKVSSMDGFNFAGAFEDICEPRSMYSNIHPEVINGPEAKVLEKVDQILSPTTPVGVEVSGPVFDKPGHGLTLVGRYQEKNTCYYVFRNSWGKKCPPYIAEGLKKIGFLCTEDGHLIASKKAFLEVLDRAAYLK